MAAFARPQAVAASSLLTVVGSRMANRLWQDRGCRLVLVSSAAFGAWRLCRRVSEKSRSCGTSRSRRELPVDLAQCFGVARRMFDTIPLISGYRYVRNKSPLTYASRMQRYNPAPRQSMLTAWFLKNTFRSDLLLNIDPGGRGLKFW